MALCSATDKLLKQFVFLVNDADDSAKLTITDFSVAQRIDHRVKELKDLLKLERVSHENGSCKGIQSKNDVKIMMQMYDCLQGLYGHHISRMTIESRRSYYNLESFKKDVTSTLENRDFVLDRKDLVEKNVEIIYEIFISDTILLDARQAIEKFLDLTTQKENLKALEQQRRVKNPYTLPTGMPRSDRKRSREDMEKMELFRTSCNHYNGMENTDSKEAEKYSRFIEDIESFGFVSIDDIKKQLIDTRLQIYTISLIDPDHIEVDDPAYIVLDTIIRTRKSKGNIDETDLKFVDYIIQNVAIYSPQKYLPLLLMINVRNQNDLAVRLFMYCELLKYDECLKIFGSDFLRSDKPETQMKLIEISRKNPRLHPLTMDIWRSVLERQMKKIPSKRGNMCVQIKQMTDIAIDYILECPYGSMSHIHGFFDSYKPEWIKEFLSMYPKSIIFCGTTFEDVGIVDELCTEAMKDLPQLYPVLCEAYKRCAKNGKMSLAKFKKWKDLMGFANVHNTALLCQHIDLTDVMTSESMIIEWISRSRAHARKLFPCHTETAFFELWSGQGNAEYQLIKKKTSTTSEYTFTESGSKILMDYISSCQTLIDFLIVPHSAYLQHPKAYFHAVERYPYWFPVHVRLTSDQQIDLMEQCVNSNLFLPVDFQKEWEESHHKKDLRALQMDTAKPIFYSKTLIKDICLSAVMEEDAFQGLYDSNAVDVEYLEYMARHLQLREKSRLSEIILLNETILPLSINKIENISRPERRMIFRQYSDKIPILMSYSKANHLFLYRQMFWIVDDDGDGNCGIYAILNYLDYLAFRYGMKHNWTATSLREQAAEVLRKALNEIEWVKYTIQNDVRETIIRNLATDKKPIGVDHMIGIAILLNRPIYLIDPWRKTEYPPQNPILKIPCVEDMDAMGMSNVHPIYVSWAYENPHNHFNCLIPKHDISPIDLNKIMYPVWGASKRWVGIGPWKDFLEKKSRKSKMDQK